MSSFLEVIQHVTNGEAVDASVTSRPTQQLENNLRAIRDLVELSLLGQALVAYNLTVESTVEVGQAVYWNPTNVRCEAALAGTVLDPVLETLIGIPEAQVLGVVYNKSSSTTADIVIAGWIKLDITNALDGQTLQSGRYYLSGQTPGMLTLGRPSLSVPVLFSTGDGNVLVLPQWKDWAADQENFRIQMHCAPAGNHTPPEAGQRHVITDPDPNKPGWLPAHHPVFEGHAPPNAAFGYNLKAHPELNRLWPPFPPEAATLIWDKGIDETGGTEVPLGHYGLALIDRHGIWWLSNCYNDVPWPADFYFTDGQTSESISESISEIDCPRPLQMLMAVYFNRTLYDASRTMVTSLRAAPNSIIRVYGCGGQAAATGDLIVDANLSLAIGATNTPGYLVLKNIVDNQFEQGPVVEGMIIDSESLLVSSTHTQVVEGQTIHQGLITITLATDPVDRELAPVVTRLSDTKERYEGGIAYIGFPAGYNAAVLQVFNIPSAGLASGTKLEVRLTMLGTAVGTLPALNLSYLRIPRGTLTPASLPNSPTSLTLASTPPSISGPSLYVELLANRFDITPGDVVQILITRSATDGYAGEVGVLRSSAVLITPAG